MSYKYQGEGFTSEMELEDSDNMLWFYNCTEDFVTSVKFPNIKQEISKIIHMLQQFQLKFGEKYKSNPTVEVVILKAADGRQCIGINGKRICGCEPASTPSNVIQVFTVDKDTILKALS